MRVDPWVAILYSIRAQLMIRHEKFPSAVTPKWAPPPLASPSLPAPKHLDRDASKALPCPRLLLPGQQISAHRSGAPQPEGTRHCISSAPPYQQLRLLEELGSWGGW